MLEKGIMNAEEGRKAFALVHIIILQFTQWPLVEPGSTDALWLQGKRKEMSGSTDGYWEIFANIQYTQDMANVCI